MKRIGAIVGAVALAAALSFPAAAAPQANGLHWARISAVPSIPIGDNLRSEYRSLLESVIAEWNRSGVIELHLVPGTVPVFTTAAGCYGDLGTINICNGVLGTSFARGSTGYVALDGHISRAGAWINDTYTWTDNPTTTPGPTATPGPTPTAKACKGKGNPHCQKRDLAPSGSARHVLCHEIGHAIGLGHSSDSASCMTSGGSSGYPAPSDIATLVEVYAHDETPWCAAHPGFPCY